MALPSDATVGDGYVGANQSVSGRGLRDRLASVPPPADAARPRPSGTGRQAGPSPIGNTGRKRRVPTVATASDGGIAPERWPNSVLATQSPTRHRRVHGARLAKRQASGRLALRGCTSVTFSDFPTISSGENSRCSRCNAARFSPLSPEKTLAAIDNERAIAHQNESGRYPVWVRDWF